MSDNLASDLRGWARSGLTRDLYQGATPLCHTLAQAADRIEALEAELANARAIVDGLGKWDGCWPGNVNLDALGREARAMKGPTP
jgi:hypothetical protein